MSLLRHRRRGGRRVVRDIDSRFQQKTGRQAQLIPENQ